MFEVKEKPKLVEKAFLVAIQFPDDSYDEKVELLDELEELVSTLGIGVVGKEVVKTRKRHAKFLVGTGKMAEVGEMVKDACADVLIFDDPLSPAQQRNWEAEMKEVLVIDRHEIILDIFAERATTKEASLQVDLARMEYNMPRLKRAWTHLSRQRGGAATQRGEGESQLELDQRMIRKRISMLKAELVEVVKRREVQRRKRMSVPIPTVAIVGYTNAGKSSMLNAITGADVLEEDKLFATLDPTSRRLKLPSGKRIVMTDTVGFVRKLPHRLIEAFKATLEEAVLANLLIHVVDMTSSSKDEHFETTRHVLEELGAKENPYILVFNKADMCEDETLLDTLKMTYPNCVITSTKTGLGLEELQNRIEAFLKKNLEEYHLVIPHSKYDWIAKLHSKGVVREEKHLDDGVSMKCIIPEEWKKSLEPFIAPEREEVTNE